MLTLLIADDEYFILERLKHIVDYHSLGYQLIATAQNGHDAMQIIEQESPDLAILDIKMPCLSGLDIAEQIYKNKWKTKVVILTSYDYFDYARQAVSYQVFSYLLKPVNIKELKEILTDAAELISGRKERDSKLLEYEQLQTELRLQHFLTAGISSAERKELFLQFPDIDSIRAVCCVKLGNTNRDDVPSYSIRKSVKSFPHIPQHYYIEYQDNIVCLLLKERNIPYALLTSLQCHLQESFHTSVNIALARNIDSIDCLPQVYAKCLESLQNTIFAGENTLVNDIMDQNGNSNPALNFDLRSHLSAALQRKNINQLTSLIHDAFLKLQQSPDMGNLEALLLEVLSAGKSASLSGGISYTARKLIDNHNSVETLEEWCCCYLSRLIERSTADTADLSITKSVMEMIQESYSDPELDLSCIAEKIGYTQNYISGIFKRNTGLTVVQYITQCRMNTAYLLLTAHHMPINQVYGQVGYSNPFYFIKRFKQYFGYSPSECPKAD